jgi:hypothetical protein
MKSALFSLPLLLATVSAPTPTPAIAPAAQEAVATRSLSLHQGQTYQALFRQYEAITGEVLLRGAALEAWAAENAIPLHDARAIPPAEASRVFQGLLRASQLALLELPGGDTTMKQVVPLHTMDRRSPDGLALLSAGARYLPLDEVEAHAEDTAIAYSVALPVEGDARDAANRLRALVSPYGILSVAPGPDGRNAIVTGFGSDLAHLVRLVRDGEAAGGGGR